MFEPAHGSSPKYSGMDKVNPVATVLSGAWMVKYLGEVEICDAIFAATEDVINEGKYVTYDLGGKSTLTKTASEIDSASKTYVKKINLVEQSHQEHYISERYCLSEKNIIFCLIRIL